MRSWFSLILVLFAGIFVFAACVDESTFVHTPTPAPTPSEVPAEASFKVSIENVTSLPTGVYSAGLSDRELPAIPPGDSHSWEIPGAPGQKLSFVSMFIPSNDFFYAPSGSGIPLFVNGEPNEGDLTDLLEVWDAGTERDQPLGIGSESPFMGGVGLNTPDPNNRVRIAEAEKLPLVEEVVNLNLEYLGDNFFQVTLSNVSPPSGIFTVALETDGIPPTPAITFDVPIPITVAFWVVHNNDDPLFTEGQPDRGQGLQSLAEEGNPFELVQYFLGDGSSLPPLDFPASPFAPGVWAVHGSGNPIFVENSAEFGEGLEALAEDGEPSQLAASLAGKSDVSSSGVFNTPDGAEGPRPSFSGESYSFEFSAVEGDRLSFATMFVQSNDWFAAPVGEGIPLFSNGSPISGDITAEIYLWDAGTELDELPGLGANQPIRQGGPNIGTPEVGAVVTRSPAFDLPLGPDSSPVQLGIPVLLRVTISAN